MMRSRFYDYWVYLYIDQDLQLFSQKKNWYIWWLLNDAIVVMPSIHAFDWNVDDEQYY